jgi:hypothetical protein
MQEPQLVGYGVDTLILNVRYTDEQYQPLKRELAAHAEIPLDSSMGCKVCSLLERGGWEP